MNKIGAESPPTSRKLLGRDDPSPVIVTNPGAASPILLIGDHAGREIPERLGSLGLSAKDLDRHIAWDIGVAALGLRLSEALDATFVRQVYSRLVIDCNRVPGAAGSIAEVSDETLIPGNAEISPNDARMRLDEIYQPYQDAIAAALDQRRSEGRQTVVVSLHSFTPTMQGQARPWRYGVLHRGDSSLSRRMLELLRGVMGEQAGDNQPYSMNEIDNTIPLHADARGLDYLELEVRQDLIATEEGRLEALKLISQLLPQALAR